MRNYNVKVIPTAWWVSYEEEVESITDYPPPNLALFSGWWYHRSFLSISIRLCAAIKDIGCLSLQGQPVAYRSDYRGSVGCLATSIWWSRDFRWKSEWYFESLLNWCAIVADYTWLQVVRLYYGPHCRLYVLSRLLNIPYTLVRSAYTSKLVSVWELIMATDLKANPRR